MYTFSSKLYFDKRFINIKTGEVSLSLQVVINRQHRAFPLKLRWLASKVDLDKGVLLPRMRKDPDLNDYQLIIDLERGKHAEIIRTYRLRNAFIDIKKFAIEVKVFDNRQSFTTYMERKIQNRFDTHDICDRTRRNARSTLRLMVAFNLVWNFSEVNSDFIKRFKNFLIATGYKEHKEHHNYTSAQIWTKIKDVKAYLAFAAKEPMISVDQSALDFKNSEPEIETIFLDEEELRRLMIVFSNGILNEMEQKVLTAFLFACFTSLRISDVYRVNSTWLISDNFLRFLPHKNRKYNRWITIPIMPIAKKFIDNTNGKFFELPCEAEYNRTLKDIAVKAKIKKHLTSHVARHTFGHLFMETIGNLKALQEIMGHKKIKTTERYAHLSDQYKLDSVKKIQDSFSDLMLWKAT